MKRAEGVVLAAALVAAFLLMEAPSTRTAGAAPSTNRVETGVVDLAVSFSVVNENRSRVACQSDGLTYTVRGHLVAPRSLLLGPDPRAITVYLHNLGWSQYYWHFIAVPGYDYATEMARLGHASLTYDLLGYGTSGRPVGTQVCYGSQADITSQIIADLRAGNYTAKGMRPATFQRVALASQTDEGLTAHPEAYSFGNIDALIITSFADELPTQTFLKQTQQIAAFCANGGEPANGKSGPPGYVYVPLNAQDFPTDYFVNADPAVVSAATQMRKRTPCGEPDSAVPVVADDETMLPTLTVPVLLVYGLQDALWSQPSSGNSQKNHYTSSRSVTARFIDHSGNALALERTAPQFRGVVSRWLCDNFEKCVAPPERCQEADGDGDFQGNNSDGNFQFDADNACETGQKDTVDSTNRGDEKDFHSTEVRSTKRDEAANTMTISGVGVSAGKPVAFSLVALETGNGVPGWVSMRFSDGFTNAGNLTRGSIVLH